MKLMQFALTSSVRDSLSYICKFYGTRPDLVQAGGGNISIKYGDELFIKSSGCTLFEVEPDKNISVVNLSKIREYNASSNRGDESEKDFLFSSIISGNQPSLETFFHAKTRKYTVHLHPVAVVHALQQYKSALISKYGSVAEFVDYYRPGLELSDKMNCDKQIVFLDKHGLVVHSNDLQELVNLIDDVVTYCSNLVGVRISLCKKISQIQDFLFTKYNEICYVICTDVSMKNIRQTPDCVIYSGGFCSTLNDDCSIRPTCITSGGFNFIASKSFLRCKQVEEVLRMYSPITTELSISDVNSLLGWDSEKYRQREN